MNGHFCDLLTTENGVISEKRTSFWGGDTIQSWY